MINLKSTAIRVLVLLAVLAQWPGTAQSQQPADPRFSEEFRKQESIYRGKGEEFLERYVIDRSLQYYASTLAPGFDRSLADLGSLDRWLDIGAGQGQAVLDYYAPEYDATHAEGRERRGTKARSVAMSIEDRRTPQWSETAARLEPGKIQYLFGRRLRDYTLAELGRFQLITDLIGGFSYTSDLSLFMERTLELLAVNGSFYTLLQDVGSETGTNVPYYPGSPFLTEIRNTDGADLKVCAWLKSITCVEVTCQLRSEWKPPIEIYRVRKVCDNPVVPVLEPVHFEAGTPPERRFQLKKNSPPDAARAAR